MDLLDQDVGFGGCGGHLELFEDLACSSERTYRAWRLAECHEAAAVARTGQLGAGNVAREDVEKEDSASSAIDTTAAPVAQVRRTRDEHDDAAASKSASACAAAATPATPRRRTRARRARVRGRDARRPQVR